MSDPLLRQRQMVENYPTNELARFSLGKALFDQGNFAEAREHFNVALQRRPDWMVVHILLVKSHLQLGDLMAGKASLERGLQLAIEQHHEGPQAEVEEMLSLLNT